MKVRFIIPKYRCRLGHDHREGDTCELPDHVAVKLMNLGYAEAVREQKRETTEKKRKAQTVAKRTITKADFGEEA